MRLKWFLVALLSFALLHSVSQVRAQHEDYPEDDNEDEQPAQDVLVGDHEDLIETSVDEIKISETAVDPPPPQEEFVAEEEQQHAPEIEEVEAIAPDAGAASDVDSDVKPQIKGRKMGNYYFDEDYYNSNYDVDLNYDWSEFDLHLMKMVKII